MRLALSRLVPLAALLVVAAIATLTPGAARACVDSGMPAVGPREPFDAGPGCVAMRDSCGIYRPYCDPDGGQDAGPVMCSEWADTAPEGPPLHYSCSRDEDCPGNRTPAMVCGAAGYCECPIEVAAPSGCSVAHGVTSSAWALVLLALVLLVARSRRVERRARRARRRSQAGRGVRRIAAAGTDRGRGAVGSDAHS